MINDDDDDDWTFTSMDTNICSPTFYTWGLKSIHWSYTIHTCFRIVASNESKFEIVSIRSKIITLEWTYLKLWVCAHHRFDPIQRSRSHFRQSPPHQFQPKRQSRHSLHQLLLLHQHREGRHRHQGSCSPHAVNLEINLEENIVNSKYCFSFAK